MKILLVDDSKFARFTVKKHLQVLLKDDQEYFEAACGYEAIDEFKKNKPDLVFIDLLMPDITGDEVIKEIRKIDSSAFIVMLTSNFQEPVKQRVLNEGANLFVSKTITEAKIQEILTAFFEAK